jgi:hypothetical protein
VTARDRAPSFALIVIELTRQEIAAGNEKLVTGMSSLSMQFVNFAGRALKLLGSGSNWKVPQERHLVELDIDASGAIGMLVVRAGFHQRP